MTAPSSEPFRPFLTNDEALSWFMRRRGGGVLYDQHMSLIHEVFGNDVPIRLRAAVDPSTGQATVLIIDIMRPPDDDEAWRQLVQVQEQLLERQQDLAGFLKVKDPFRRIVLSLGGEQSSWADLVAELEREE
jgi:hypothetical protein